MELAPRAQGGGHDRQDHPARRQALPGSGRLRRRISARQGDPVLLRKREKRTVIAGAPKTSVEFKIDRSVHGDKIVIVTTASVSTWTTCRRLGAVQAVPRAERRRSRAAVPHAGVPWAERIMRDAIKGSLNGVSCNAATNAAIVRQPKCPPRLIHRTRSGPAISSRWSASTTAGSVRLRRAATCRPVHDARHPRHVDDFCPVCRFVLVEQIDPEQHRHIDAISEGLPV